MSQVTETQGRAMISCPLTRTNLLPIMALIFTAPFENVETLHCTGRHIRSAVDTDYSVSGKGRKNMLYGYNLSVHLSGFIIPAALQCISFHECSRNALIFTDATKDMHRETFHNFAIRQTSSRNSCMQVCAFVSLLTLSLVPELAWLREPLVHETLLLLFLTPVAIVICFAPTLALFIFIRILLHLLMTHRVVAKVERKARESIHSKRLRILLRWRSSDGLSQ